MTELIKIHNSKTGRVVDSRELHKFLECKTRFIDWITYRINQYGFIETRDYIVFLKSQKNSAGGRPLVQYAITLDMAKELCMIENNSQGKKARQYFIEAEKLSRQHQISLPTRKELAEMVIEAENEILNLKLAIDRSAPLVRYAQAVQRSDDSILVRQLAKHISNAGAIKVGQNRLFAWMRAKGYLSEKNEPYQRYVDAGLFGYSEINVETPGASFTRRTTRITGKGRVYFIDKYLK